MGVKHRVLSLKIAGCLIAIALSCSLTGCNKIDLSLPERFSIPEIKNVGFDGIGIGLSEVAPPDLIQQLDQTLENYQPQVSIVSPQPNETLSDTKVEIVLAVEDYPLFKDENLGMGPHLNLIVDNEDFAEVYDLQQPIIIQDLKPGTHSLKVLAEKPWHESFKNPEAFAQNTFNILTTTDDLSSQDLPLLTYNQPSGTYNAEPILLDFYLTGIQENDWQIQATINQENFIIDEWQPIYLKGFQEGNNLIELKLLDGKGNSIENQSNQPIRLITYDPSAQNQATLAQLFTNQIAFQDAVAITNQNYDIQPIEEPSVVETIEEPTVKEIPVVEPIEEPTVEEIPIVEPIEEPTVEDLSDTTSTKTILEDTNSEIVKTELDSVDTEKANLNPEAQKAIADRVKEAIETADDITISENSEETTIKLIPPVEKESPEIAAPAEDTITTSTLKDNISTTSVDETTATALSKKDNLEILQEVSEMPIPEKIRAVETENNLPLVDEEESETITIEVPKPKKLKVPQWWKNLVANLQQRFNLN